MKRRPITTNVNVDNVVKVAKRRGGYLREGTSEDKLFKNNSNKASMKFRNITRTDSATSTIHVYHNIKRHRLYATYENGVKVPVEYNSNLSTESRGVYIISRHNIPNVTNTDTVGLREYYDQFSEVEEGAVKDICTLIKRGGNPDINSVVRFIKFIPYEDLERHVHVLDSDNRLLVSYEDTTGTYPLPADYELNSNDADMNINIFDTTNPGRVYYANVFGVVRQIKAGSSMLGDYCILSYTENSIRKRIEVPLDELDTVGVYGTYEEALSHGDLVSYIELAKFNHSMETMKSDSMIKLTELRTKLEMSKLAKEEKVLTLQLLDEKIKMERVKADTVLEKGRADSSANNVKSLGTLGTIINAVGGIVSKVY